MNIRLSKSVLSLSAVALIMASCGSAPTLISTPVENIDALPLKVSELTEQQKQNWGHADLATDTIPGMSVDKAYKELIGNKKGTKVIVAVMDSGMDLNHEDLKNVLWTNKKEIPGNNIDDDNNGFIDDVHGYNFLGDSYNEQLESARIVRLGLGDAALQAKAKAEVEADYAEALAGKQRYEQILQAVKNADEAVKKELGKDSYTKQDLASITAKDETMQRNLAVLNQMYSFSSSIPEAIKNITGGITYFTDQVNFNLNKDFNGREPVGDNPYDITDTKYGNGNPINTVDTESHGTHVAGIIAAERNNGKGANGVANNVELMSIRTVPNGDEYDKDIALGIRYAVDNGAKVINASFGKAYSPKAEWVYEALKYAAEKDVLFVHAAGNDGANLDDYENHPNYPNDQIKNGAEFVDNVITVGALANKYGSTMLADFSNYGKINVDVFAPGAEIYSTMPGSKYEYMGGTSMASPGVAGVAAVIRSQYPKLTAAQVKKIIMQSGIAIKTKVVLGGDPSNNNTLANISTSGKMVNLYNALLLAESVSKGQVKL
ncbi:S8 family serine peptidase [Cellulophaga lytica]|nr:S8 family serine peptidase [Cellulophaga lytica]